MESSCRIRNSDWHDPSNSEFQTLQMWQMPGYHDEVEVSTSLPQSSVNAPPRPVDTLMSEPEHPKMLARKGRIQ